MAFADKYMGALSASSLLDDDLHHKAEPLQAAAMADRFARDIGALLHRVKYAGTVIQKLAQAVAVRERAEKDLAEAIRKKDASKEAELRQVVGANAAACAMAGSDAAAFRSLYVLWAEIVEKKGRERQWIKPADWPKIGHLAPAMYRRVAEQSLAHYLDDVCKACNGTGAIGSKPILRTCLACEGSRKEPIGKSGAVKLSDYEIKLVKDMVSELTALEQTHAGVANSKLRREV
jgi:hypothetical protein